MRSLRYQYRGGRRGTPLRLMENFRQKLPYYLLALVIISLDQYTKLLALHHLTYATPVPVMSFLNWTLLFNTGAAFSFLSDAGGWQHFLLGGLDRKSTRLNSSHV